MRSGPTDDVKQTYRCLNCLEATITRAFDTSHLSTECESCGSFGRFINETVLTQFESFEESPPADLDWSQLDRTEKLLISEQVTRHDRSIEDFSVSA
jgi:late competence protein required for DNA uptake (superfamily II DNA/RNA helicase)